MPEQQINRTEAIKLITPVVDGEISKEKEAAFFRFIQGDPEIERLYREQKRIKNLVSNNVRRFKAPQHLRNLICRINSLPEYSGQYTAVDHNIYSDITLLDVNRNFPPPSQITSDFNNLRHYLFILGALLATIVLLYIAL